MDYAVECGKPKAPPCNNQGSITEPMRPDALPPEPLDGEIFLPDFLVLEPVFRKVFEEHWPEPVPMLKKRVSRVSKAGLPVSS